jgi:para-nitrobenzyl esterase
VLNVWKPTQAAAKKLPVMVWIYGGGFVNGGSSPAVYDGSQLARQNVVLVSFNYRVGRFGFFAHPALTNEDPDGLLGNYGFMDQIAALKWVQKNITAFGGDPNNVTLFGESAGGFSVHTMMTSPLAKGLFHKAIIESGGGRTGIGGGRYLQKTNSSGFPSAEEIGMRFAAKNHISGTDAKALAALRALPAETVTDGLNMMDMGNPTYSGPLIDGKVVTAEPQDIYRAGAGMNMPLLVGANDVDIGFPPKVSSMEEALAPFGKDNYQQALQAYNPDGKHSPQDVAQMVASDQMMVEPGRFAARMAVAQGQSVYVYRFGYVADSLKNEWQGALHATEIPYVFNTVKARYDNALTANDSAMAEQMQQYWVNFAKTGNPNADGLPIWPRYDAKHDQIMIFPTTGTQHSAATADSWQTRLDLIEKLNQ